MCESWFTFFDRLSNHAEPAAAAVRIIGRNESEG